MAEVKIYQGSDKNLIVRLKDKVTQDPYDLNGIDSIEACFQGANGTPVNVKIFKITGDTDGSTDLIINIPSTVGLVEGQAISGPGVPSGSTIIKTPTSTVAPTAAGTIQISQITTAVGVGVTLSIGDEITILGSPFIGKINVSLSEAKTALLEEGEDLDWQVKIVKGGFTSIVVFEKSIDVLAVVC